MLLAIEPQPGVFRNGTEYEAAGRWFDASLVRWYGRQLGPVGGWRKRSPNAVSGQARAILPWKRDGATRWIAVGTHLGLFVQNAAGQVSDITPSDFVAGAADESVNTGFGAGVFGAKGFGTPRPDTASDTPALVWDLDLFGEVLVGCAPSDGRLLEWNGDPAVKAQPIANAPTGCLGVAVTEQGFVMALGAGGGPRTVRWSDQGDRTQWTPSASNQAGEVELATAGALVRAVKLGPALLVLTDLDAHVGSYIGLPFVFGFQRAGHGCGALSKGCAVTMGQQAAWWSTSGFWLFDGAVHPIECEIWDHLIRNLNTGQRSKITSFHNSEFGEAWWFYPSGANTAVDSYVYWDYRRNHWGIGELARTCAVEAGVFKYPLAMDSNGYCFEQEVGDAYDGATPFAETGPIELGDGDQVMRCLGLIPDEATAGQASVTFKTRPYPDAAETVLGETALTAAGRVDLRFTARQARMRVSGSGGPGWRFGRARLDLQVGGQR